MSSAFLAALGRRLFGMTADEAHRLGCCVRCRRDVNPREMATLDQNEWLLSGLCPECFDYLTPAEDECE